MARYVALVDGRSGSYGLTVPDLPGCTSAAATIDQVLRRATEAVRLWAEDALADGEKLPKPRSIEAVRADPEVAAALAHGAVLAIVPLVRDAGRPVKAISRWTLACSPQSTRQRPRADSPGQPSWQARRAKRSRPSADLSAVF